MSIFISYSRRDADFVRRVHEALVARGRETWVDWEGIPPSADWMRRIEAAIDAAEAVVCVLTADFIASAVCAREVAHAVAQHKRLIPIVPCDVTAASVPAELGRLNWVNFASPDGFAAAVRRLIAAIDTDLAWVDQHTRLLVRAVEWDAGAREGSLALRGADLKAAEAWLALGPAKTLAPTELQTRYVLESRRLATRRRSQGIGAAALAMVVIAVVSTMAFAQRREATRQEAVAVARRLASTSERLRDEATVGPSAAGPAERSLQLAAEALLQLEATGQRSFEADLAMRRALALTPKHLATLAPRVEPSYAFDAIGFVDADHVTAAAKLLGTTASWDLRQPDAAVGHDGASGSVVALSPDGRHVALASSDQHGILVTALASGETFARIADPGVIGEMALAPGGRLLAVRSDLWRKDTASWGESATTIRALPEGRVVATLPSATGLTFSPDGHLLAGVVDDRARLWSVARLLEGDAAIEAALAPTIGTARRIVFSTDGTHVAANHGDADGPVRVGIWRVADRTRVHDGGHGPLKAVGPAAHYIAVGGDDDSPSLIRVIDVVEDREAARLGAATLDPVVAFAPGGRDMAFASGPRVELRGLAPRGGEAARVAATASAMLIGFVDDETLAAFVRTDEGALRARRWRVGDGHAPAGADLDLGRVAGPVARSADGRWLALADGAEARIVDAASGAIRHKIVAKQAWTTLALSEDGRFVAGSTHGPDDAAGAVELWQSEPLERIGVAVVDGALRGLRAAVTHDGTRVSIVMQAPATRSGEAQSLHVFEASTMTERATSDAGQAKSGLAAAVCAVSGDGRLIAVDLSGGAIALREAATGRTVATVDGASGSVSCAFSADGDLFASAGGDAVRVWDVATQTELARLEHVIDPSSVAFSPGGRYVAALAKDGTLTAWPLRPVDLLADACERLAANIDPELWERTMGARAYRAACPGLPIPGR